MSYDIPGISQGGNANIPGTSMVHPRIFYGYPDNSEKGGREGTSERGERGRGRGRGRERKRDPLPRRSNRGCVRLVGLHFSVMCPPRFLHESPHLTIFGTILQILKIRKFLKLEFFKFCDELTQLATFEVTLQISKICKNF